MMDQEFSKREPSPRSGTKQTKANSEAKCEISVYTCAIFNVFLYKI